MHSAMWWLVFLMGCQQFCIISTDNAIGDHLHGSQLRPHPLSRRMVSDFEVIEPLIVPSKAYLTGSWISRNVNPSNLQQQTHEISQPLSLIRVGNMPFRAPSRARQPSKPRQDGPSDNQQAPINASGGLQRTTTRGDSESEIQEIIKERKKLVQKRPHGAPYRFCDQFGCHDCIPPDGAKCCSGFKYDPKANRCRQLV
ncbi:uncharacterized protein LOC129976132 [Argiope bruennichi]|uniref:Chitin-binding type-2 domain-containing protein n=1 Tax=Argiope bruennichi TaxID=94029 RepID=A0A8T0ELJ0_ARGBR|nr:uncharacterized protein LOC129976132 [Argiope bruennichi]KAF8776773.1 hypothetical protein HNY73_013719 [Argiope bruennichi]